jgi:hypothetical protein
VRMRLLDCCAEFTARDVHVGLERGHAFGGPVIDEALRVVRVSEFLHLGEFGVRTLEVRCAGVKCRAGHKAGVDALLQLQIRVRFDAAGGAHGGDSGGEVEAGRGVGNLCEENARFIDLSAAELQRGRSGVVEVIVHADEAGDDGVAGAVEDLRPRWWLRRGSGADGLDIAIDDDEGLVLFGCGAGAVDDADVVENEDGGIDGDERRDVGGKFCLGEYGGRKAKAAEKQCGSQNGDLGQGRHVRIMVTA